MRTRLGVGLGIAVGAAFFVAACSDVTSPRATPQRSGAETPALLGGGINSLTSLLIAPVNRTVPLANDVTWTFTAGPNGGSTSNPDVGLMVVVPQGALNATVTISVTALAGAPVAYRFEPHLAFDTKVYLTQDLRGTTAGGLLSSLLLRGAHFAGDVLQLDPSGLAIVDEIVPALLNSWTRTVTFGVEHFSGWIVASGNGSEMQ